MTARRSPFYPLCLLAGAVLFGGAGLFHPVLRGDGAEQLALIAGTRGWHVIHWSLLFALPLMLAGLAGLAERHLESPGAGAARAGLIVAAFAFGLWALNILFMAGVGSHLASTYAAAEPGLAATHAVFLYDMLHPFGLAAERIATFGLGLALYLFGWAMWNGRVLPKGLSWGAFGAGILCLGVPLAVAETSVAVFYGQAAAVTWMAVMGAVSLVRR
jgi:hypothetical protein